MLSIVAEPGTLESPRSGPNPTFIPQLPGKSPVKSATAVLKIGLDRLNLEVPRRETVAQTCRNREELFPKIILRFIHTKVSYEGQNEWYTYS